MWHLGTATRFLLGIYKLESNWSTLAMPLSHSFQHRAKTPLKPFLTPFIWGRDISSTSRKFSDMRMSTCFMDETDSPVNNWYLKTRSTKLQRTDPQLPQLPQQPGCPSFLIRSRRPAWSVRDPVHHAWVHTTSRRSHTDSHFGRKKDC